MDIPIDNRQLQASGHASLMCAIDDLLFDLEELVNRGFDRVPATLRERAARVFALLPTAGVDGLRPCRRVVPMIYMLSQARASLGGNLALHEAQDQAALDCTC